MAKDLKCVGGYIRVSTEEQSRTGLSLESQEIDIKEYCRRMGYQLTEIYIDKGITARKNLYKREAFMRMMHDVESKRINHIVVIRLDRFFRNVYDYHRMMHEFLDPAGCGWSAVKEEYDTTTTNGRLMINLRLSIAEQECDQDSDRIKDVFANRIKEGYVVTGIPPLGYKIDDRKKLVPNEDADTVRFMFDSFLQNNSVRLVLKDLRARRGIDMKYDRIIRTLRKEIYIGKYRENENFCEPLISKETFYAVQRGLDMNIRVRGSYKTYIFSGIIKCACCGRTIFGSSPNTYKNCNPYKYYKCNNAYQNLSCPNRHNTNEAVVEKYLLENIEPLLQQQLVDVRIKESSYVSKKGNRKQIMAKIDRLTDLFVNGVIDMDELKRRKAELESQIVEDEVPPKRDVSAILRFLNSGFRNIYGDLADAEKQRIWRSIIKEIRCEGNVVKDIVFL